MSPTNRHSEAARARWAKTTPAERAEAGRKARRAQLTIDHYITKLVDAAPPLTAEQRAKLAALLDARRGEAA